MREEYGRGAMMIVVTAVLIGLVGGLILYLLS